MNLGGTNMSETVTNCLRHSYRFAVNNLKHYKRTMAMIKMIKIPKVNKYCRLRGKHTVRVS